MPTNKIRTIFYASIGASILAGFLLLPHPAAAACLGTQNQLRLITRDADGKLLPSINYVVYAQATNPDGQPYLGSQLAAGKTGAGGEAVLCVSKSRAPYAVKLYQYSASYGTYQYWQADLAATSAGFTLDARSGYMDVTVRDARGTLLKNIAFSIFVQEYDVDGKPIIGESRLNVQKQVYAKYSTGITGNARAYLSPGTYVVKFSGANGAFYVWDQRAYANARKPLDYRFSMLRFTVEDPFAQLLTNQTFSIYKQATDAHSQPMHGTAVRANLSTGSAGSVDVQLLPGVYSLRINGAQNGSYDLWNVAVRSQQLSTVRYRRSSLRVIVRDGAGKLLPDTPFSIGYQGTNAAGEPTISKAVFSGTTGALGVQDVFLVPNRYVLSIGTSKLYYLDIAANQVTIVDWPRAYSLRPAGDVVLSTPVTNTGMQFKTLATANVYGLPGYKRSVGKPYQVTARTVLQPFTVTFFYNAQQLAQRGINPTKLRVAYYNEGLQTWKLVGGNNLSVQRAAVVTRDKGLFMLVEVQ